MNDVNALAGTTGLRAVRDSPNEEASSGAARSADGQCTFWTDAQGAILDCCEHTAAAFGYAPEELRGMNVAALLPDLADVDLLDEGSAINPRLAFKCRCSRFRAVGRGGLDAECTLFLTVLGSRACPTVKIIVAAPDTQSWRP